jgi:hypothetical protein
MSDKILVPLKDFTEINAAMACLDKISMPQMNFLFSIHSRMTAKMISFEKCWRSEINRRRGK